MNFSQLARPAAKHMLSKIDRVWLSFGLALLALALFQPEQVRPSLIFVGEALIDIAPFLVMAIFFAAYALASQADRLIAQVFRGNLTKMVVLGALFGAFSPFCSCGVIPLIAAALSMGVHLAPVMAFWLASPLMDPTMFLITSGELGSSFALAKTGFAIALGLMGGYVTLILCQQGRLTNPLRDHFGGVSCCAQKQLKPQEINWKIWQDASAREKFFNEGRNSGLFLVKWLSIAYLLESLMMAYVPPAFIAQFLGQENAFSLLWATLVGVPAYLNGYAAVPLVAGLMETGMSAGAAMAFLVAGGVTSIPAAIAVFALARLPVFFLYIAFALSGALFSGLIYQAVI